MLSFIDKHRRFSPALYLAGLLVRTGNLGLYLIVCYGALRLLFIGFGAHYGFYTFDTREVLDALVSFSYHDLKPLAIVLGAYFIFAAFGKYPRLLISAAIALLFLAQIALSFVDMVYYYIYNTTFDAKLFMLLDGKSNLKSVIGTGLKSDYPIWQATLLALLCMGLFIYLFPKVMRIGLLAKLSSLALYVVMGVYAILIALMVHLSVLYMGTVYVNISPSNPFLLNITNGPLRELYLLYKAKKALNYHDVYARYAHLKTPSAIASELFNASVSRGEDIAPLFKHSVSYPNAPYERVFYLVGESLSYWYFDFGLLDSLRAAIKGYGARHAISLPALQNAPATKLSLGMQLLGLYQMDLPMLLNTSAPHTLSIIAEAKRLGYTTYFIYAGHGTWGNLDKFTKALGIEHVLSNANIIKYAKKKGFKPPYANYWGARDDIFMAFLRDYPFPKKSFIFTMSTANHPPYDTDIQGLSSIDVSVIAKRLAEHKHPANVTAQKLAHATFYTNHLVSMIKARASKDKEEGSSSLFLITGDHYDRMPALQDPPLEMSKFVPFVAISPTIPIYTRTLLAKHLDITPSILELITPKGGSYYAFNKGILSQDASVQKSELSYYKEVAKDEYALGYKAVATPCYAYDGKMAQRLDFYPKLCGFMPKELEVKNLSKDIAPKVKEHLRALYRRLDISKALSTYILEKGFRVE